MPSPYSDPSPHADPDVERTAIEGRLRVARNIHAAAVAEHNARRAGRWGSIVDELLDRLNAADEMAALVREDRQA